MLHLSAFCFFIFISIYFIPSVSFKIVAKIVHSCLDLCWACLFLLLVRGSLVFLCLIWFCIFLLTFIVCGLGVCGSPCAAFYVWKCAMEITLIDWMIDWLTFGSANFDQINHIFVFEQLQNLDFSQSRYWELKKNTVRESWHQSVQLLMHKVTWHCQQLIHREHFHFHLAAQFNLILITLLPLLSHFPSKPSSVQPSFRSVCVLL